ncbi:MAG: hypothetical protein KJ666_11565 [Bacteroidetes bacterium]|nr:hypothetical protein [Bacteroidota bacterium]
MSGFKTSATKSLRHEGSPRLPHGYRHGGQANIYLGYKNESSKILNLPHSDAFAFIMSSAEDGMSNGM